jgi:hypothetical protein
MTKTTPHNTNFLAYRAFESTLTLEQVNHATKQNLEEDRYIGYTVLYWASFRCPIEVVCAILDKQVNIDGLSTVSSELNIS